jgi:hypothetical protein
MAFLEFGNYLLCLGFHVKFDKMQVNTQLEDKNMQELFLLDYTTYIADGSCYGIFKSRMESIKYFCGIYLQQLLYLLIQEPFMK